MRWGLIGASNIAKTCVVSAIRAQAGHDVKSVMSSSAERGRAYADEVGLEDSTDSLDELLADDDIGAVYISTTNEKHFAEGMAAIKAGKHVLCEKPLAMSVVDAVTMVRAAREAGVVFATNHHLRNAGSHLRIKGMIDAGEIGRVQAVRVAHAVYLPEHLQGWRLTDPAAGGGVIPDIVVHDADTVRFHLGEDPVDVVAMESADGLGQGGVEDSCMSVWRMPSGALVETHEGFTIRHAGTSFEVHGEKGSIIARNVMTQRPVGEVLLRRDGVDTTLTFDTHNLYERSLSLFAAAVEGRGAPSASGEDGVKSLAVAAAVKEAAVSGRRVAVDYGGL